MSSKKVERIKPVAGARDPLRSSNRRPTPRQVLAQPGFRARIAARALEDETFRRQLSTRPRAAIEAELSSILGRHARLPASLEFKVHQETAEVFHFVCPAVAVVPREEVNDLLLFWEHILRPAP